MYKLRRRRMLVKQPLKQISILSSKREDESGRVKYVHEPNSKEDYQTSLLSRGQLQFPQYGQRKPKQHEIRHYIKGRICKIDPLRVETMTFDRSVPEVIHGGAHKHEPENCPKEESSHNRNCNPTCLDESRVRE